MEQAAAAADFAPIAALFHFTTRPSRSEQMHLALSSACAVTAAAWHGFMLDRMSGSVQARQLAKRLQQRGDSRLAVD
jgi:hypothetical protein